MMRRRTVLTGTVGALGGAGLLTALSYVDESGTAVAADIDEDSLQVADTADTLDGPPSAVALSIGGSYAFTATETVDQFRIELHLTADGTEHEMATELEFSPALTDSGTYSFDVDMLDHPALDADDFYPEEGQTETITCTATVVGALVDDHEYVAETRVSDDFDVTVTAEGFHVGLDGSGEVTIET